MRYYIKWIDDYCVASIAIDDEDGTYSYADDIDKHPTAMGPHTWGPDREQWIEVGAHDVAWIGHYDQNVPVSEEYVTDDSEV